MLEVLSFAMKATFPATQQPLFDYYVKRSNALFHVSPRGHKSFSVIQMTRSRNVAVNPLL